MTENRQVVLPVMGMTCANCVSTIERNVKKLPGVSATTVNLSTERATIDFNPDKLRVEDLVQRIEKAGYGVATGELTVNLKRLPDHFGFQSIGKSIIKKRWGFACQGEYHDGINPNPLHSNHY